MEVVHRFCARCRRIPDLLPSIPNGLTRCQAAKLFACGTLSTPASRAALVSPLEGGPVQPATLARNPPPPQ